ncbi:MAG: NAD-dependent epimerase/dehydratase family protein [Geminicoccaceae bacterium]|nr:NAD-dependent epimerase/dehydratase family protein [Geminicoccaceae bacterium]
MELFVTGASGYIGGSVAAALIEAGHQVRGLVRSDERAAAVRKRRIEPVQGGLDDADLLAAEAARADGVINCAVADHRGAVEAMLPPLEGSGKLFLHTSGSSVAGDMAAGEERDPVYDETTPIQPPPGRAARVAIDELVLGAAARGVRAVVIRPTLIYGRGRGLHEDSIQVPWLVQMAKEHGRPRHIGAGGNRWSNVHIDDLVDLYLKIVDGGPAGALYYAENGECSMRELCQAIGRALGQSDGPEPMSIDEAAAAWGEGAAIYTMGSNSRVRAKRARYELDWRPSGPSLLEYVAAEVR